MSFVGLTVARCNTDDESKLYLMAFFPRVCVIVAGFERQVPRPILEEGLLFLKRRAKQSSTHSYDDSPGVQTLTTAAY